MNSILFVCCFISGFITFWIGFLCGINLKK